MRSAHVKVALATVCIVLGLSACGGDSDEPETAGSAAVAEQVDAICDEWRAALDSRGEFPVGDFDPAAPDPEDLPAVGEYNAEGIEAQENALAALRDLASAQEAGTPLNDLIAAVELQLESVRTQVDAARDGDVAGFTATLDDAVARTDAVDDAADELGARSYGF